MYACRWWISESLLQQLAGVVLFLHLVGRDVAGELRADVLADEGLAVVRLEPGLPALLLHGVQAGPGGQTAEEAGGEALRLVHVGVVPAFVPVPLHPVIVLLELLGVGDALRRNLFLQLPQ